MATDWVELFDLDLAKAVVRMDAAALERFIAEAIPTEPMCTSWAFHPWTR